jgi:hypothetical protein
MAFGPLAVDVGIELLLVGAHEADQGLIAGVLMARSPQDHFGQDRSEVNAFGRKRVDALAPIGGIFSGGDEAVVFEAPQTLGENIGGDFFFGLQKFVEASVTAQHHVAQDEQRPAVAEHFDGGVERTARPALGSGPLFRHSITVAYCHLQGASKVGRLFERNRIGCGPSGRVSGI